MHHKKWVLSVWTRFN